MFLVPFNETIKEFKPNTNVEYVGIVEDNNDPEKLGRVRARIPLYEDIPTDKLPWCRPIAPAFLGLSMNSIMFSVPEIGSEVCVYFPDKDKYQPVYKGANISQVNKCTFFDEDYPNVLGFKDSVGNFFKVNKARKTMQIQHSSSTNIFIEENGDITITHKDGSSIKIDSNKNITHTCNKEQITADSLVKIVAPVTEIEGALRVSTGKSTVIATMDGRFLEFTKGILTNVY